MRLQARDLLLGFDPDILAELGIGGVTAPPNMKSCQTIRPSSSAAL